MHYQRGEPHFHRLNSVTYYYQHKDFSYTFQLNVQQVGKIAQWLTRLSLQAQKMLSQKGDASFITFIDASLGARSILLEKKRIWQENGMHCYTKPVRREMDNRFLQEVKLICGLERIQFQCQRCTTLAKLRQVFGVENEDKIKISGKKFFKDFFKEAF